jgi:hypothetical protein
METNQVNSPCKSLYGKLKDRQNVVEFIRNRVEKSTGLSFKILFEEYSEQKRYYLALRVVTTSNKAVCEAMRVPVEAGTRAKDALEKEGRLVASIDKFQCPYTGEMVQFLSTNPKEFEGLKKSKYTQLKLFPNE